ncbi:tRNA glutamyl-Q(34) synthetase GluQRS [Marinimicrobium sp. ARAG 43.8]|uniref:tRNA glutamyl-Q(34) synthetase GluQRS n=1 Tax=Marinimicrobium sp. ARAG 43.8 TaxID=3418719 RepID=UPI003CF706E0
MPTSSPAFQSPTPARPERPYIGRFAPSPTGPLHFGSLVSALASYLHARHAGGQWLIRMEDLDPPREAPGARQAIEQSLQDHGLIADAPTLYQSDRLDAYAQLLEQLHTQGLAYRCRCTRREVQAMGGVYDGRCRSANVPADEPHAWRLTLYDLPPGTGSPATPYRWHDLFQGEQSQNLRLTVGDPIIKRRDGLFAYPLAVVADDLHQGITHVIRGADLLPVTAAQSASFALLGGAPPQYGHVPMAMNRAGQKLSKQNFAPPLKTSDAAANLWLALAFLNQRPSPALRDAPIDRLLSWGIEHWQPDRISGTERPASEEGDHDHCAGQPRTPT